MEARIEFLPKKELIAKSIRMSLTENKTFELWNGFMTQKSMIKNVIGSDLYSIQVYDNLNYFKNFNPTNEFTKWAGIEVGNPNNIPNGFSSFTLEAGLYAVFIHKGLPSAMANTMQFIMSEWLPNSAYTLDYHPHFEILGEKYKKNSPDSEEEVWIPIKKK